MKNIIWVAVFALPAACSDIPSPSYPSDWPSLSSASTQLSSGPACPRLTGVYDLPENAAAYLRGARRKGEYQSVHHFLGINSQLGWLGMPARLELEGPDEQGLKVTFFRDNGKVTVTGVLQVGVDFTCQGKWIVETQGHHGDGYITTSYARDVEGRLIGFKGISAAGAGMVEVFGVRIPLVGLRLDRTWWRLEPAPSS